MRKIFSLLAATMMLTTSLCAQEISLKINNQVIETEIKPIQEDGTTLVPIRVVTEYLGAQVEWNEETQTVTIVKANQKIELTIGSKVVKVNGVEQTLQCAPKLIEGTTMVPIRLVSENFGGTVGWEEETGTISIQTNTEGAVDTENTSDTENTNDTENTDDTGEECITGTITYPNGTYTGEYIVTDEGPYPHGKGKIVLDTGDSQEGIFEKGELVNGKKIWVDGNYEEGIFENQIIVDGKVIMPNGIILEGNFKDANLYEGTITYFFKEYNLIAILHTKEGITGDAGIYDSAGNLIDTMTTQEFFDLFQ